MNDDDNLGIPDFLRRDPNYVAPPWVPPEVQKSEPEQPQTEEAEQPEEENHRAKVERGMRENASAFIMEINGYLDSVIRGIEINFDAYEFFRTNEVKPRITDIVLSVFVPQLDEIRERNSDPQLKEAYSGYSSEHIKNLIAFFTDIVDGGQRWLANQNASKGPRKKRVVIKPDKMVAKMKYQREDRELKLISIPPEKIIGAQELWTYNTKYRHLTRYVARTREGFRMKGTTLQDFDVDNSMTKVLRKPSEVLTEVLTTRKKSILDKLSTKPIEPTGRINEHTILLKVT